MTLVSSCIVVYVCQKIIKFYRCIQLLQAKMKVGSVELAHPVGQAYVLDPPSLERISCSPKDKIGSHE